MGQNKTEQLECQLGCIVINIHPTP
jgi:hypothetical protein